MIGGSEIYAQWMDAADRLEITEVHARPDGDTGFAAIDASVWQEVARERHPAGPVDSADLLLCDAGAGRVNRVRQCKH